ncbi:MAG: right-handed parallel beta-helix repeat-containing protein [Promethearchaeota archaeon]|jgi:parallel beta-helix repeat protein
MKNCIEPAQEDLEFRRSNLKQAGFWNNFTFIHITDLNWTIANETDWCSGSGTWGNPYLIENMIINASSSPIGSGIFIENSTNVYFQIKNVTIFGATDGIKLENTNNGAIINSSLSDNIDSGISMVNCVNNTILRNKLINNGVQGIYLFSNCINNKIIGNIAKDDGANLQDTGIYLGGFCNDNDILDNKIYDNGIYGINIENDCVGNVIYNNTVENMFTSQQDYGIRFDNDCDLNNISSNIFKDLNNYGIMLDIVYNNQIIDVANGFYMLIAHQSEIISNTISGGSVGILMSACDDGKINGNFFNNTANHAIRIFINCDDNEFHDNIIKDNNIGIQLDDPSDVNTKFYRNSFISNNLHAFDNGTATSWNNTIIGNYWDNYSGIDLNYDHIGDTPYTISGPANATDDLPIVDHWAPEIIINTPTPSTYGANAPEFSIIVNETYIYSMWYTITNTSTKFYFTENGTIDQEAWNALNEGNVTLTFYVRDIAWRMGSNSITIIKSNSQIPGDGPPPPDIIPIIIISIIVISIIIIAGLVTRKLLVTEKIKKSRKLNEEQLSDAQYFKDVSSILTVLAIHNESGLCLSKIALHGGIGLDENLFTGFLSAMGSFKDELAKQMGLRVHGEGGDNIIEYNEFTITLMDGEYLRLGLVSYNSLGDLIKEQCGQVLRNYEIKHVNDLKNFDGEIEVFKDFEETIETELDMNLNKKCIINVKQLNKYDAPESFITILYDFNSRTDGFYPVEITSTLVREMNISEQEAHFMIYEAYKNQIFLPLKLEK